MAAAADINKTVNAEIEKNISNVVSEGQTFDVLTIELNVFRKSRKSHYWLKKKRQNDEHET